ncbi:hypothetical protein HanXRQr2_Chr14g0668391 [Helianthus annuus]|uniref:Transmembrane protein n=1 Tax=Helianthus annuus TaxID=4232 RepID=A0A9K3EDW2_HELAN|nr:hypothetical protein HanXRQr2_Chr14g0668391 [Helianthus annuus]
MYLSRLRPISVDMTCFRQVGKLLEVSLIGKWVCVVISMIWVVIGMDRGEKKKRRRKDQ